MSAPRNAFRQGAERPPVSLANALEITAAAYEEALGKYGLLPDSIKVVHAMAQRHIELLDEEPP